MRDTLVISAFPACGKTYSFENYKDDFDMLDSDSSDFSWIKDENGQNTKERNPEFPSNYIKYIKNNIGKVDIIFVSSHKVVRDALRKEKIETIMIYPNKENKEEWIRRFRKRGNDEVFINFISSNWNSFLDDIGKEYGFQHYILSSNEYIDKELLNGIFRVRTENLQLSQK